GQRHRPGRVEGREADGVLLPAGPAGGGGHGLHDGNVEAGQHRHVPRVGLRARLPHGQHGGDDGVDLPLQVAGDDRHVAPLVGAERVAPAGQRVGALLGDGGAEVVDEGGVPGQEVGPVEDDADGRPGGGGRRVARGRGGAPRTGRAAEVDPLVGDGRRRVVAVGRRGAEHLVGHEPQQVGGVGRAAVERVGEGLADHGGGDGGGGGELGVERRL